MYFLCSEKCQLRWLVENMCVRQNVTKFAKQNCVVTFSSTRHKFDLNFDFHFSLHTSYIACPFKTQCDTIYYQSPQFKKSSQDHKSHSSFVVSRAHKQFSFLYFDGKFMKKKLRKCSITQILRDLFVILMKGSFIRADNMKMHIQTRKYFLLSCKIKSGNGNKHFTNTVFGQNFVEQIFLVVVDRLQKKIKSLPRMSTLQSSII